jgi:aryl-alcohol dehydrogenase-like predicted oxidoreductase
LRAESDATLKRLVNRENTVDQAIVSAVEEVASARGLPMAVVATAWCLSKEGVNPIVGLNTTERIDEILTAIEVVLTQEEVAKLEAAYLPKAVTGY